MSKCLKGKSEVSKDAARFRCGKCNALTDKKSGVCKPVKLEKSNNPKLPKHKS